MKKLHLICLLLIVQALKAQQSGRMETDRPDQTEVPFIVKKGYIQAEWGFNRNQPGPEWNLPASLIKFGLSPRMELRYVSGVLGSLGKREYLHEALGFKYQFLSNPKGNLPITALIVQYHFKEIKRDVSDLNPAPHSIGEMVFTMQNELGGPFSLGYNLGAEWHDNRRLEYIYRVAPGLNLGKNGYFYAEVFGRLPSSDAAGHWFDGGFAYYLSDHVKLDASAGRRFGHSSDWYLALGLSFRIKVLP